MIFENFFQVNALIKSQNSLKFVLIKFYVEIMNHEIEIDHVKLFVENCFDVFIELFIRICD